MKVFLFGLTLYLDPWSISLEIMRSKKDGVWGELADIFKVITLNKLILKSSSKIGISLWREQRGAALVNKRVSVGFWGWGYWICGCVVLQSVLLHVLIPVFRVPVFPKQCLDSHMRDLSKLWLQLVLKILKPFITKLWGILLVQFGVVFLFYSIFLTQVMDWRSGIGACCFVVLHCPDPIPSTDFWIIRNSWL